MGDDTVSKILYTLESCCGRKLGVDVRVVNEKIEEANKALRGLGISLRLQSIQNCFPVENKLYTTTANVLLIFKEL